MANQLEALRKTHDRTWDMWREGVTYVAVRRWKLKPTEQYCGLSNQVRKRSFAAFAAELGAQDSLYKSLIDYKKPATS